MSFRMQRIVSKDVELRLSAAKVLNNATFNYFNCKEIKNEFRNYIKRGTFHATCNMAFVWRAAYCYQITI